MQKVCAAKGAMSRTFKDQPWWYRSTEWDQIHLNCELQYASAWGRLSPYREIRRACTLPPEPDLKVWRAWARHHPWDRQGCLWAPRHPRGYSYLTTPPKWFRDHIWINPNRMRERAYRQEALKEFRANGDVEAILPPDKSRHSAGWLYW